MPERDEADGSQKPKEFGQGTVPGGNASSNQKVPEEERKIPEHVFGQGTHPDSKASSRQKMVKSPIPEPKIVDPLGEKLENIEIADQQPPDREDSMAGGRTAEKDLEEATNQEDGQFHAADQVQPAVNLAAPASQKNERQSAELPQQEENRNAEPELVHSGKIQKPGYRKTLAPAGRFHVDNNHMPPSGEPPVSTLFSKVIMGFTVIFLIMVLVRLIQIRMKQRTSVSNVMKYNASSGASCCYVAIATAILMTGCLMVFIMHSARQAKERQHRDQMAWNYITAILLVLGVLVLMKYNQMVHQQHMSKEYAPIASHLWIYLVIAAAALAAAKISNRLLQLKHVEQNRLRP